MENVEFISWDELSILHVDQLEKYGGQQGFIDEGVVRSVMSRPQFTAQYVEDADLADLAADYMFGFATTQGFMDGNKRTALTSALLFVRKNGWNVYLTENLMYFIAMAVWPGAKLIAMNWQTFCAHTWKNLNKNRLRPFI